MLPLHDVLSHTFVPSPPLTFPCPTHDPYHDKWQSKWHAYAPPFYGHTTLPPSCLVEPSNRGKISPSDLSQCQSKPLVTQGGNMLQKK
jgi:hypothetical protein